LFGLGEIVARIAVQGEFAQWCEWDKIFWHNLRRVEEVESEAKLILFFHYLSLKLWDRYQ
tara:strand:- start:63 stop:242 length:180 start_codon:yes stop_codon:yes gene_type:complete